MAHNKLTDSSGLRARNLRLGLILASVAVIFFVGFVARLVIFKH